MKLQELLILLPCHGLEDFPMHHEGDDADSLLACWTALWHPQLLAITHRAPRWARVDDPPAELTGRLLLVPTVSSSSLPTGFAQRARDSGAILIRKPTDRQAILDEVLGYLEPAGQPLDRSLVSDFFALGYGFLQIQLLTRQMRYSSNLDEVHFNNQLLEAAEATVAGDETRAKAKLTACFDLLAEERDHFYAVDAFLIDLTLTQTDTPISQLSEELNRLTPGNLIVCGELLARWAQQAPATIQALAAARESGRWGILGGESHEGPLPLLGYESILAEFKRGAAQYQNLLGRTVDIYARVRCGLSPVLPQILHKLGFVGALHATLGEGRFPHAAQIKMRWEGNDRSGLDALGKLPLDAARPETFLGLASRLSETMDMDHVATLCLAHWPCHASRWYEDLQRCARYGAALGRFVTVDEYFRQTYAPAHTDRFEADQYRTPYLKQDVIRRRPDPLSRLATYQRQRQHVAAIQTLTTLACLVSGTPQTETQLRIEALAEEVDRAAEQAPAEDLNHRLESESRQAAQAAGACLVAASTPPRNGYLLWNPLSFPRRVGVDLPGFSQPPAVQEPVFAAGSSPAGPHAVVDLPPLGYVWLEASSNPPRVKRGEPPLAEDCLARDGVFVLRNEFFEGVVSPTTGSLQSLKDYRTRGNRISQQLALRQPGPRPRPGDVYRDPDATAQYSVMAAQEVRVTAATPALGEITSAGRLLNRAGETLAEFRQVYRVWRGSRVLQVEIELLPHEELPSDPWHTYFTCRFAWADEAAELFRGNQQSRFPVTMGKRLEATDYFEVISGNLRTTIFPDGLAYHRRTHDRMLDTLLLVRGETARSFRLGIGVDVPHPLHESLSRQSTPLLMQTHMPAPQPPSAWLFHLDSRGVVATCWEPLREQDEVVGFRTRLLETTGQSTRVRLSAFRTIRTGRRVNFWGQTEGELRTDEGRLVLEMNPHEWAEIEARW